MSAPDAAAAKPDDGALAVELKMRNAISALLNNLQALNLRELFEYCGVGAAVMLHLAARTGGLDEMVSEYRRVRPLLGAPSDWPVQTGACVALLDSAYNAALTLYESRPETLYVVLNRKNGGVLAGRFNELEDGGGMAHMRWMPARHAVGVKRDVAEKMAACFNALSGNDSAVVMEMKD